jgi:molybdopterin-guanine dinucleotide biosynthesis protein A
LGEKKAAPNPTALILAGGAGRRIGNRDKGLLVWRGAPLIEHVCDRLKAQTDKILISCNRNAQVYSAYADQVIVDRREGFQGPLAGIESALSYAPGPLLLVTPCDIPLVPLDLAQRLVAALRASPGADIAHARCDGRDHYLCVVLRTDTLAHLSEFLDRGGRAVRDWFATRGTVAVDFSDPAAFLNVNTGSCEQP